MSPASSSLFSSRPTLSLTFLRVKIKFRVGQKFSQTEANPFSFHLTRFRLSQFVPKPFSSKRILVLSQPVLFSQGQSYSWGRHTHLYRATRSWSPSGLVEVNQQRETRKTFQNYPLTTSKTVFASQNTKKCHQPSRNRGWYLILSFKRNLKFPLKRNHINFNGNSIRISSNYYEDPALWQNGGISLNERSWVGSKS